MRLVHGVRPALFHFGEHSIIFLIINNFNGSKIRQTTIQSSGRASLPKLRIKVATTLFQAMCQQE